MVHLQRCVVSSPPLPLQARSHAVGYLQRCVVSGEKLAIAPPALHQSLTSLILPMTHDFCKLVAHKEKDFPQVGAGGAGGHGGNAEGGRGQTRRSTFCRWTGAGGGGDKDQHFLQAGQGRGGLHSGFQAA